MHFWLNVFPIYEFINITDYKPRSLHICLQHWINLYFLFFILSFLHLLKCVYNVCCHPPSPASWQNLFCPLVLRFCWGKDSYTERFLALLPWTCVLQFTLVHLYQTDLFTTFWSPSHSGLCQFKIIIFALIQWAHQLHSSFKFPSFSLFLPCAFSTKCVTPVR
jgi:hypothetical protein